MIENIFISAASYQKVFNKVVAKLIANDNFENLTIQLVGIERGGVIPLIMLDYFLKSKFPNVKIERTYLNISFYDSKNENIDISTIENTKADLTIIVDDLLDKGLTFEFLFSKIILKNVYYLFLYDKQNYSKNCRKILNRLKRKNQLFVGKKCKPEKWLFFWYDYQREIN